MLLPQELYNKQSRVRNMQAYLEAHVYSLMDEVQVHVLYEVENVQTNNTCAQAHSYRTFLPPPG